MNLVLGREVVLQPRVFERGTGKDAFFGEQIYERYTAPSCATGDRQISCQDITHTESFSYSALGSCIPGCSSCGLFKCCCTKEVKTGVTCECERMVEQPISPIGNIIDRIGGGLTQPPETFPIGAAGTTVTPAPSRTLTGVLVVGVLVVVGYFLYKRGAARG